MITKTLKVSEILYFLAMNRGVNPAHVTKIAESIRAMGCIRSIVVVKTDLIDGVMRTYIVEGQHLFHALVRLGLPVTYVEITIDSISELISKMALLNASSKPWSMVDYIHAWSIVNPDIQKLSTYYRTYDMELSVMVSVLMDLEVPTSSGGSTCLKHIKKGTLKIVNEKTAVTILKYIDDIFTVIKRLNREQNKFVCAEFVRVYRTNKSKYNHARFMKNLKKNKESFILATHEPQALVTMFKELI